MFFKNHKVKLEEPADKNTTASKEYYVENGYVVFTEAYHLKRGSCCGSGCRHCPYKKNAKK